VALRGADRPIVSSTQESAESRAGLRHKAQTGRGSFGSMGKNGSALGKEKLVARPEKG